ncbi:MAG: NYN domain-containing protein [Planctomycetota bacterium]
MDYKTLILVDGENLIARFEAMLREGRVTRNENGVVHDRERFLWCPILTRWQSHDIVRVSYFTTLVGDDDAIANLESRISQVRYEFRPRDRAGLAVGYLCPRVFKKPKQSYSSKSVDINLTIDALRHSYSRSADRIVIFAGDGDYVPLVQEVMRQGVQVFVGAFSSGLNPELPRIADAFLDLDPHFLNPPKA